MMKLTTKDLGKYYLVCDEWETLRIETVCIFTNHLIEFEFYPYRMFCLKGHWEGRYDTFNAKNIIRELSESEALAMVL